MNSPTKITALLLALWLVCWVLPAPVPCALAQELPAAETTLSETVPPVQTEAEETAAATEAALPETIPAATAEATEPQAAPTEPAEETIPIIPTAPESEPPATEPTQSTMPAEEDPFQDDEWLFTLTDVTEAVQPPLPEADVPAEPGFSQFAAEHRLEFLLAAAVFALFGAGTCWFGKALCGLRFLLRLRGIRTTGTLTRISRDYRTRACRCTMTYPLENGRTASSEWPVQLHLVNPDKYLDRTYTVYYNPKKPKEYDCTFFGPSKLLGTLTVLAGLALMAAALAAVCCVLISFAAAS